MKLSEIPIPQVYKEESADFRFFVKWFSDSLSKVQYDTENLPDIYDPLRCPDWLIWMLADTMGFKYDDRLPMAFNRLVLVYFMSMIRNKGSKDGVTLAAEVNLAQFNIIEYGKEKDILNNRLEDTSIPVNSVSVTPYTAQGFIDVVYFSDKVPINACIEYVRPLGMYLFEHAGVRMDGRTKIAIDAELTNIDNVQLSIGPTHVGHYSREDYSRLQRVSDEEVSGTVTTLDTFTKTRSYAMRNDDGNIIPDPNKDAGYPMQENKTTKYVYQDPNPKNSTAPPLRGSEPYPLGYNGEDNPATEYAPLIADPRYNGLDAIKIAAKRAGVTRRHYYRKTYKEKYSTYTNYDYRSLYDPSENSKGELSHDRQPVYYRNSKAEGITDDDINPGYRALYSLQLCNNEHIVRSLIPVNNDDPFGDKRDKDLIFGLGYHPTDVSISNGEVSRKYKSNYVLSDEENIDFKVLKYEKTSEGNNKLVVSPEGVFNLRYDRTLELADAVSSEGPDIWTIEDATGTETSEDRSRGGLTKPRPAVNPIMTSIGDAISLNKHNTQYILRTGSEIDPSDTTYPPMIEWKHDPSVSENLGIYKIVADGEVVPEGSTTKTKITDISEVESDDSYKN